MFIFNCYVCVCILNVLPIYTVEEKYFILFYYEKKLLLSLKEMYMVHFIFNRIFNLHNTILKEISHI